jgi:cobyrinic acid a,c-diamide synthase
LGKAFIVAAPTSASGKTLITLGLIRALRNRGVKVASAKAGPDYIDPRFHEAASGQPCCNLDLWSMGQDYCLSLMHQLENSVELIVIEGVMGLFDGPHGAPGSTADLAAALGIPVVLVIDTAHQAQSVAALVYGFKSFRTDVQIAGVILNRVRSDRHLAILKESLSDTPVLGVVRQSDSLQLPSRHLGLVQAQEIQELEDRIETIAATVARETELDRIIKIATAVPNLTAARPVPPLGQRMAIARDEAFAFCYPHLLQGWRDAGAEMTFFSPLQNEPAPDADAIFLPGGYPELHAARLASNLRFLDSLRNSKALIYGECGGYMVLGDALVDADGTSHAMAGLLPLTTSFARRKLHLGYRQLQGGPWASAMRGHEFHYSTIASAGTAEPLFTARDAAGNELGPMGQRRGRIMGSYAHVIAMAP